MNENEVVLFRDGEFELAVNVNSSEETVWLTRKQIADLFDRDIKTIGKHINNALKEELEGDNSVVAKFATTAKDGKKYMTEHYNLDMIISIGVRVKSSRGVIFRKWAIKILANYLERGYVIDESKFVIPDYHELISMFETHRKMGGELLASDDLLSFLFSYKKGLRILDDYDHGKIFFPQGTKDTYVLEYEESIDIIRRTSFKDKGSLFAIERDESFKSSISTIYQTYDGNDLYPTLEEKASNLLYLIVKNHSFIDGNKRIGAIIFLYFLEKNEALYVNGRMRISNDVLATLTILVAISESSDKESVVNLILMLISAVD